MLQSQGQRKGQESFSRSSIYYFRDLNGYQAMTYIFQAWLQKCGRYMKCSGLGWDVPTQWMRLSCYSFILVSAISMYSRASCSLVRVSYFIHISFFVASYRQNERPVPISIRTIWNRFTKCFSCQSLQILEPVSPINNGINLTIGFFKIISDKIRYRKI